MQTLLVRFFLSITLILATMNNAHANDSTAGFDLQRYMGRWYVISNIPYFPERGKVATYDEYILRTDGRIDNIYGFKKAFGKKEKQWKALATVTPDTGNKKWTIKFFGLMNADYEILEVAPDYSWALIGHPKRKLGWVFSRDPKMGDELHETLLNEIEKYDYQKTDFKRVPQFVEQVGKPGFQ